jgi:hypothetical protein
LALPFGVEITHSFSPGFEITGKSAFQMAHESWWKANSSESTLAEKPRAVSGFAGSVSGSGAGAWTRDRKLDGLSDEFRDALLEEVGTASEAAKQIADLSDKHYQLSAALKASGDNSGAETLIASLEQARVVALSLNVDMSYFDMMVSPEFKKASEQMYLLTGALGKLKAAGIDTGGALSDAIRKVISGAQNKTELDALNERIALLGKNGELTEKQMTRMSTAIESRMKVADSSIRQASDAAKRLGLELSQFSRRVSPKFEELSRQINDLADAFEGLKTSGVDAENVIQAALKKGLDAAKNPADLNALADKIVKLGEEGKIARPKVIDLFKAVRDKAKEAGGEAGVLKKEFDDLKRQADAISSGKSG